MIPFRCSIAGAFSKKYEFGRLKIVNLLSKGVFRGEKYLAKHFVRTNIAQKSILMEKIR